MENHEKTLLRGLMLAKKTGYFKNVYNAVQNGLININTLGIKMQDCESEININDYLVIIIEFNNKVDNSSIYRIIRKFGDCDCWFLSYFLKECEFNKLMDYMYYTDDETVNILVKAIIGMNKSAEDYTLRNIWYIPDFAGINTSEDKNCELKEKIQKLWSEYYKLENDVIKESGRRIAYSAEIQNTFKDILTRILVYESELQNIKDSTEEKSFDENLKDQLDSHKSNHGLYHEVKYHIFDNIDLSKLIKYKGYGIFTKMDELFYKWVEAKHRTGNFNSLYSILSKGLYYKPEDFTILPDRDMSIWDTTIFLPKIPYDKMDKNVSAIELKIIDKNKISVCWFDDSYACITCIKYLGDYVISLYNIFSDYPKLKDCDVYCYEELPDENEIIDKLKEVIHI